MSLLGKLVSEGAVALAGTVSRSAEFERIRALPRRLLDLDDVSDVTPLFRCPGGELRFRPIQSAAIIEAAYADGLFAPIGVGHGKTLIALALATALDSKRAVLLVKPSLKRQLEREAEDFYGKHFKLPLDKITIVAYSELSSAKKATILEDIGPDLIIADEVHCLRHKTSARTKRFLRYMNEHPHCRFAGLSGTITKRSIKDYAHLIELALRKNSPIPHNYRDVKDWAGAIDVRPTYEMRPGVLLQFCDGDETVREGFQRRLVETLGVVATEEAALGTSLIVKRCGPSIPKEIKEALTQLRRTWSIGEEEFDSAPHHANALRHVALGFYYKWDWPNGEPDREWLDARSEWHKEVREKLKTARKGFDSPLLLANAARRFYTWKNEGPGEEPPENGWASQAWPSWKNPPENGWESKAWPAWEAVKERKPPPTIPVWISDYVVQAAIQWAKRQREPSIIWYCWKAIGERIAEDGGLPLYGPGTDASTATAPVIVCSMASQGEGKNLQFYARNLATSLQPNGTSFEQFTGRTHRPGQEADEVCLDWFGHTRELQDAMERVLEDARYMEQTTGQKQKALYATHVE